MGIIQANIEITDPIQRSGGGLNKNVEMGIFKVLMELIKLDKPVWDPVGAFFSLSCGYSIHKYSAGGGAVYDADGAEIFLTQNHIDRLFAVATEKKNGRTRGLLHSRGDRDR